MGKGRSDWGTLRALPSGRYRAGFTGPDGLRHRAPATFGTKGEARAWLAKQRTLIIDGDWTPAAPTAKHQTQEKRATILGEYGAEYIENRISPKGLPLTPATKQGYRACLRALGDLQTTPVADITPAKVGAWYRARVGAGKITSSARAYALLKEILNQAIEDGLISENPCRIRGAVSATTGRDVEPPTSAELAIIVANTPERYRALVVVAAWSALRFGEQTELRRGDVDDDGELITLRVRRGVTYVRGTGFVVGAPKTAKSKRDVVLPPSASQAVRSHMAAFVGVSADSLLFPSVSGGHLPSQSKDRWWYKARAAAGRPDLPWHGLRHYGATQYAKTGATLAELQARLGHTTVAAAMRYQHATGRDRELARRMDG